MTEHNHNNEAFYTFLASIAKTVVDIDNKQPDIDFREVFFSVLETNAKAGAEADAANGLDTQPTVNAILNELGAMYGFN